jgi:hypothetical protein
MSRLRWLLVLVLGAATAWLGWGAWTPARADEPVQPPAPVGPDLHKIDGSGPQSVERAPSAVSDASITAKLKTEMWRDGMLRGNDVHVETNRGIITLGGTVRTDEERLRVLTLAKSMIGANGVVDELRIRLPREEPKP